MEIDTSNQYTTPKEIAALADCDLEYVYKALWSRDLIGYQRKHKGHWIIERSEVTRWLTGNEPS
ncbi:helix-turn-helix domain-containing protein [Rhodococcoides fascians]|uniref:helix-turn-helix domain-containing protein n=1 Tax=Rhodococcoides fascians TaxID=1828 RepID=UPI00050C5FE5|nr:helix-turn-helix domain-containing protein [Rhodococcus fascians]